MPGLVWHCEFTPWRWWRRRPGARYQKSAVSAAENAGFMHKCKVESKNFTIFSETRHPKLKQSFARLQSFCLLLLTSSAPRPSPPFWLPLVLLVFVLSTVLQPTVSLADKWGVAKVPPPRPLLFFLKCRGLTTGSTRSQRLQRAWSSLTSPHHSHTFSLLCSAELQTRSVLRRVH